MPVDTNIRIPFVPQEGITAQILQAIQLANEHQHQQQQFQLQQQAQPSEIGLRTAQAGEAGARAGQLQAETAAGLPAAQAAVAQATAEKENIANAFAQETNPLNKKLLQSQSDMADIKIKQAQSLLDFYGHVASNGTTGTGFDQLDQRTRTTLGKLSPAESAILDAASSTAKQEGASGNPEALKAYQQAVISIADQRNELERAQVYSNLGMNRSTKAYMDLSDNSLTEMTPAEFIAARASDPNRFIEYSGVIANADKAQHNLNDIRDGIATMSSILNQKNFALSPAGRAIITAAQKDPTVISSLLTPAAMTQLSPPERQFLLASQSLVERAMSLRSIQGQGAGSDSQRQAIITTLPSIFDPDPAMSKQRIAQLTNIVNNIDAGIPKIGKYSKTPAGAAAGAPSGGGTVSLEDFLKE